MTFEGTVLLQQLRRSCLLLIFTFLLSNLVLAQDASNYRFENAYWRLEGNIVVITYDLIAPADRVFDVTIVLKRAGDEQYAFIPISVAGDAGRGKHAGLKKLIRWDYKKDKPDGLTGDDYRFDFTATEVLEEQSSSWALYAGGAGALIGAIIAILHKGDEPPPPSTLPGPPTGRPGN